MSTIVAIIVNNYAVAPTSNILQYVNTVRTARQVIESLANWSRWLRDREICRERSPKANGDQKM
jgi:hypothetical protein